MRLESVIDYTTSLGQGYIATGAVFAFILLILFLLWRYYNRSALHEAAKQEVKAAILKGNPAVSSRFNLKTQGSMRGSFSYVGNRR
jgi:hypothetical protein